MSNDGNAATMRDQDMASEMTIARQRENLERLNVGQLVRRWRSGFVEWEVEKWGPSPDDDGCLVPWHVLQWCERNPLSPEDTNTARYSAEAMSDDAFRDAMRFPVTLGCVRHTPTSA
jgi:hypothetical protein